MDPFGFNAGFQPGAPRLELIEPSLLKPTEEYIEARVPLVARMLEESGGWTHPILIEAKSHIVMDGHHRLQVAKRAGWRWVPCLMLTYHQVEVEATREGFDVSPDEIIHRGLNGPLYPPKTSRHTPRLPVPEIFLPLEWL